MIHGMIEDYPAIVVAGTGGGRVEVSVGRHHTMHVFPNAFVIQLPFLDKGVFRGTNASVARRVEMERHLVRTGMFRHVVLEPGAPGWFPISFTLAYSGRKHDGWLYYPNPYEGGDA